MVAVARLDHLREARGVGAPVEVPAVDDDAADGGAVAADPFGRGVHDDVCAVVEGAAEVTTGAESVVYDDGDAFSMCHLHYGFEIGDIVAWVADTFQVYAFGLVVDDFLESRRISVVGDKAAVDTETGKHDFELVIGAAVEVRA